MVIDAHVHLYAPEVMADPRAWGDAQGEPWWTECVTPHGRTSLQGWASIDQLLRDMDAAGIDQAVLLGWYWEHHTTCVRQNDWYAAGIAAHPDRLLAFATINPKAGAMALEEAKRRLEQGFRGLGELLPSVQGFSFRDDVWIALMELCERHQAAVNLHVTDPTIPTKARQAPTPLDDMVDLARTFPRNAFILAHWGGGLPWHELNPRIRRALANCVYDSAASPLLYDPAVYAQVLQLVGADRIVFGTDYPLRVYPKRQVCPSFVEALTEARAALPPAAHSAFFAGNANRLLNRH